MRNFVIFSLSRWNIEFGCNIKDISLQLAKSNNVLFVDVPLKRKERWFRKSLPAVKEVEMRLKHEQSIVKVSDNLWHYIGDEVLESVNGITHSNIFDFVNRINNKRFANCIKKAINAVGFHQGLQDRRAPEDDVGAGRVHARHVPSRFQG